MTTFKDLGLNADIVKSLDDMGFTNPTPIQAAAIPFILQSEQDLIALAQTGTGKTAAFSLPVVHKIQTNNTGVQAIILCPTRELCMQISHGIADFAKDSKKVSVTAVYGGESIGLQIKALKRGTSIVVGTPGRVHDLIRRNVLKLGGIKWLVLDEADEMLDMGFKDDLDSILSETPTGRQTLLFSATMSKSVRAIAKQYMSDAHEIKIGTENVGADTVTHEYYVVNPRDRFEALQRIIDSTPDIYGIVFCRTRHETQEIADKLNRAGYETDALHGDVSQTIRTKIMAKFKRKQLHLLVATDVAARGIDVNDLTHVINYNLPDQSKAYTHRSGRTGRAQKTGVSISLVGSRETRKVRELERIIGKQFELKKVPAATDVFLTKVDAYIAQLERTDTLRLGHEDYFAELATRLAGMDDLMQRVIADKFGALLAESNKGSDLNAASGKSSSDKQLHLKVNIGKKHGADVKTILSLINSNKKLKGIAIGTVTLHAEHSVFAVAAAQAKLVTTSLRGKVFRGKKVTISSVASSATGSYTQRRPRRRRVRSTSQRPRRRR